MLIYLCQYEGREWREVKETDEEYAATEYAKAEWRRDRQASPLKAANDRATVCVRHPEECDFEARKYIVVLEFDQPSFYVWARVPQRMPDNGLSLG